MQTNDTAGDFTYNTRVITLDVLDGSATLILTPDKTVLIGVGSGNNAEKTVEKLKGYGVKDIDVLILNSVLEEHVLSLSNILENFNVKSAFVPDIISVFLDNFPLYKTKYEMLLNRISSSNVKRIKALEKISFNDGFLAFLTPLDKLIENSSYSELFSAKTPTEEQVNNISPILYFSYKGVRFVFSNFAGKSQEQTILEYDKVLVYDKAFDKGDINLSEIDFFSLSRNGSSSANSVEFIETLKAKNLLISVSGNNKKGCPSEKVLNNALSAYKDCKMFSTAIKGDICAYISADGDYVVKSQKEI
jgi:competence protein ComEC